MGKVVGTVGQWWRQWGPWDSTVGQRRGQWGQWDSGGDSEDNGTMVGTVGKVGRVGPWRDNGGT
eukprot:4657495-Pyramimonas_sp.AAC.1